MDVYLRGQSFMVALSSAALAVTDALGTTNAMLHGHGVYAKLLRKPIRQPKELIDSIKSAISNGRIGFAFLE